MIRFGKVVPADLEPRLEALAAALSGDPRVAVLYLCGSRARGEADELSDVDLVLLLDGRGGFEDALHYTGLCNEALGTDEVGLTVLDDAPVALAHSLLRDARPLYVRDEAVRADFEQKVERRWLDFRPYLDAYDRDLFRAVREAAGR